MKNEYRGNSVDQWAKAIALRISDEWDGNVEGNEKDVLLLRSILEKLLRKNPHACQSLIGTTIIEEEYFDSLH